MAEVSTFTEGDLRELAGARSFERGQGYRHAVTGIEITADGVTATVHGGDAYEVTLTMDADEGLSGECECPFGQDGNFCKHCVAVGLVVLGHDLDLAKGRAAAANRGERLDAWLEGLSRERLLTLLREQLAEDGGLRRRLEVRAATEQTGADIDVSLIRTQIKTLLDITPFGRYGFVEYADAGAYAAQIGEAVDALRSLTAAGEASATATLTRETLERLHRVYEQIDDSSGAVGDVAAELEEAHRAAWAASDADPVETSEWLAAHMLGEWSHVPEIDLGDYWDLLGDAGRARFKDLVAEASRRDRSAWATGYLRQEIARVEDDVDALVTALAENPAPYGQTHLSIARALDLAGRSAEALEWADRGLRETARHPLGADLLGDYVAERYERAGRLADLVAVRRRRFEASLSLGGYRDLRDAARKAGRWDTERPAALDLLRAETPARPRHEPILVDALVDDGDGDAAWQAAEGRASDRQWLAVADLVRDDRPADALSVYRRAIESRTHLTGDDNYRKIVSLLLSVRDCHHRLGTDGDFTAYVTGLRDTQRRKRNLMKILDQHGL